MQAGQLFLADLNEEVRRRVLVISNQRFGELAGRVLVVPEVLVPSPEVNFPWRVQVSDGLFAVDLMRSLAAGRLLGRHGQASFAEMAKVQRALKLITSP